MESVLPTKSSVLSLTAALAVACLTFGSGGTPISAQTEPSEYVVFSTDGFRTVGSRIDQTGTVTSVVSVTNFNNRVYAPFVVDTSNRELLGYLPAAPRSVSSWDLVRGGLGRNGVSFGVVPTGYGIDQNGTLLASGGGSLLRIDHGRLAMVGTMERYLAPDLVNGGYIAEINGAVRQISRSGTVGATLFSAVDVTAVSQDFVDGSWVFLRRDVAGTSLLRYDRAGATTTILRRNDQGFASLFVDVPGARWPYVITNQRSIVRVDRAGNQLVTTPPGPALIDGVGGFRTRHLASIQRGTLASPNLWDLSVSFPTFPQEDYFVALSLAGFTPGTPMGQYRFPLTFDKLTTAALQGRFSALLSNDRGVLDSVGEAVATLDLRGFGTMLSGVKLWAAAAAYDRPDLPTGRVRISKPILIELE